MKNSLEAYEKLQKESKADLEKMRSDDKAAYDKL